MTPIRRRERAPPRRLLVACLLAGLVTTSANGASNRAEPNELDPQDALVVPGLVQAQQAEYQRLRAIWRRQQTPDGLPEARRDDTLRDSGAGAVGLHVRNVDYEIADGIGFHIESLAGALVPHEPREPVNFDDPEQYDIHIYAGRVTLDADQLDALFNRYVLAYAPRALSSVANQTRDGQLIVNVGARLFGFLSPAGGLPTQLVGPVHVTDDNSLAYTPDNITSLGLPLGWILAATGLKLATLTPLDRRGVRLTGNTLIMDPQNLFPAPGLVIDHIDSARLSDQGLTLTFSSPHGTPTFDAPPVDTDSYIWMQSGDARFFSTVLVNTRLLLMNDDHKRLHFHLYHYRAQTAAGRIDAEPDGTLIARVPNHFDIDDETPEVTENAAVRSDP